MAKFLLPWWVKIIGKFFLSRLPFGYNLWQRLGLFRHGQMDKSGYAIKVFNSHVEKSGLRNIRGTTLLELGPGDSISTAIIAASHGAQAVLVDAGPYVRTDISPYFDLVHALAALGLSPPDLSDCLTINDILTKCQACYHTEGLHSLGKLQSASFDLIFSQAVLEHVRKKDFLATISQCCRLLKSDGICSHEVDLRDHLDAGLNNLRFSEQVWESDLFVNSGFYTNRIRYSEMLTLFAGANFNVSSSVLDRWDSLPIGRSALHTEFAKFSDDDLNVKVFSVLLKREIL